jgi:hypothetical protein
LPEYWFHGAGPQLAVLPPAGMPQAPPGTDGGRVLLQVPGPLSRAAARPGRVLSQRREQPQLVLAGAGEVLLAEVAGIGEHGAQLRADPGLGQLVPALIEQRARRVRPAGGRDSSAPTIT